MEDKVELAVIGQLNYVLFPYCYLHPPLWELQHTCLVRGPQSAVLVILPLLSSPPLSKHLIFQASFITQQTNINQHLSLCSLEWKHKYMPFVGKMQI